MNLETRKLTFIQNFVLVQDEGVIIGLEKLLYSQKIQLSEEIITPMSVHEFYSDIDKSFEDSQNKRYLSAKDLKTKVKKWS